MMNTYWLDIGARSNAGYTDHAQFHGLLAGTRPEAAFQSKKDVNEHILCLAPSHLVLTHVVKCFQYGQWFYAIT